MGVMITISEVAKAQADALVARGRFESVEQMVEAAIQQLLTGEQHSAEDERAWHADVERKVEQSRAQVARGEVLTAEQVFEPVLDRLRRWPA